MPEWCWFLSICPPLPPFSLQTKDLDVAGDDAALLVVAGGVASQLQDLGGQVLQDSCRGEQAIERVEG